jgi:hypothetical protein
MVGAAFANAITFALSKWARLALVHRFVGIQPYDRHYVRLVAPSLAGLAAMWLVHSALDAGWLLVLAATVAAGLAVYGAVYAVAGLTPSERSAAARLLRAAPLPGRADTR